jgi:phage terminase small subunit
MSNKFMEQAIAEDIKEIVRREVALLKDKGQLDGNDAVKLEKYAKIYSTLMSSHREDLKHGVFGNMSDEELESLLDE